MGTTLALGDITVDVVLKDIKNVHLTVHPPTGRVRITAPLRMNLDTIRVFAISKLAWIKSQQKRFREQERESSREYVTRETHYIWGRRCLLRVVECDQAAGVEAGHNRIVLRVRPGADRTKKQAVMEEWYRRQLRLAVPPLLVKWEPLIGVRVPRVFVQQMKTKWGSCNPRTGSIRLNTALAKKPPACLEYVVVHEMVHLLEPSHNSRFIELMNRFMPKWQFYRDELNRLPVCHEDWAY